MLAHTKYEELCALAGAGKASPEELAEFQTHAQECSHCRELHKEFLEINSLWICQALEVEPEMYGSQSVLEKDPHCPARRGSQLLRAFP